MTSISKVVAITGASSGIGDVRGVLNGQNEARATAAVRPPTLRVLAIAILSLALAACSAATPPASAPGSAAVQSSAVEPRDSLAPAAPDRDRFPQLFD